MKKQGPAPCGTNQVGIRVPLPALLEEAVVFIRVASLSQVDWIPLAINAFETVPDGNVPAATH
jgi:hypothetical protein